MRAEIFGQDEVSEMINSPREIPTFPRRVGKAQYKGMDNSDIDPDYRRDCLSNFLPINTQDQTRVICDQFPDLNEAYKNQCKDQH